MLQEIKIPRSLSLEEAINIEMQELEPDDIVPTLRHRANQIHLNPKEEQVHFVDCVVDFIPNYLLLFYRIICMLFCFVLVLNGIIHAKGRFFIFLTNLSLTYTTLFYFLNFYNHFLFLIHQYMNKKFPNKSELPKFRKIIFKCHKWTTRIIRAIMRGLFPLSLCNAIFVTVTYWTLLHNWEKPITFQTVGAHGVTAIFLIIEIIFSRLTIYWIDLITVVFMNILYLIFIFVYHYYYQIWIYHILDSEKNNLFWLVFIGSFGFIIIIFCLNKLFVYLREKITQKYKMMKQQEEYEVHVEEVIKQDENDWFAPHLHDDDDDFE